MPGVKRGFGVKRTLRAALTIAVAVTVAMSASLIAVVLGSGTAYAQLPATSTALPGLLYKMVVDDATGRVFVSLYDTSKIAVLDFDGNLVTTITGEAGARGLALVGSHLYVVAANAGAIDDIDTTTLTRTRTVASGRRGRRCSCPRAGRPAGTARTRPP